MAKSFYYYIIVSVIAALAFFVQPSFADGKAQNRYVGVNLAGAEFNAKKIPGRLNKDYIYPSRKDFDYFIAHGFNTFRIPFRWERLQPELGGEFKAIELRELDKVVGYATAKGATVILDPHNYAIYSHHDIGSEEVPNAAFAGFWAKLADRYKANPRVFFGLMNEPFRIRADTWRRAVDAAIHAIRATGARNLILVPGTIWSGAHSWQNMRKGGSNARAFRDLTDPGKNIAFEVHQYFDHDYSGQSKSCSRGAGARVAIERFTKWLRENKHRGFLGEFGVADNEECLKALDAVLRQLGKDSDVWLGWTYWAAGAWWGNYMFSVHPSKDGEPKPQLKVLKRYTGNP